MSRARPGCLWRALLIVGATACLGCEVITLEPDLDLGPEVDATPTPVLGDGGAPDVQSQLDADAPDLAPDPAPAAVPVLTPAVLSFGAVEPYSTAREAIELRAGRQPMVIDAVSVGGDGFALDGDGPPLPFALDPYESIEWTVGFTAAIAGRDSAGELVLRAGEQVLRVPLTGRGAWSGPPCAPWLIEVDPAPPRLVDIGTPLLLKAKPPATVSLSDVGLHWATVESPLPPARVPLERFDDPQRPAAGGPPDDTDSFAAVLLADKPGRYAFVATPLLPLDAECAPQPSAIAVHACPCPDRPLHIRIAWQRAADAPPGRPWVVPLLVSGSAGGWDDGLGPGIHRLDWGQPGPLDDPRLDIVAGDTSGRADIWLDRGRIEPVLRLGLGLFHAPDSPRTAVDISVEILAGAETLASLELASVEAGSNFWDVAAIVRDPTAIRVVAYDRVLEAQSGRLPDLDAPLGPDAACDPWFGPRCAPELRCHRRPDGGRCRP